MEDFRAGERIGKGFEAIGLDRLDLGKFPQKGFVHHIIGGVHELGNANCHIEWSSVPRHAGMPFTNRKVKYLGRYTDDPASGQTNECLVETRGCGEDSNIERGTFASCAFPPFDLLPVPLPGVCASRAILLFKTVQY